MSPILEWAYSLREADPEGAKISNEGGWQSRPCLPEDGAGPVLEMIAREVGKAMEKEMQLHHYHGLRLRSAWVNISGPGAFNWEHDHPNSFYSGVLYLKTPANCGRICFSPTTNPSKYNVVSEDHMKRFNLYPSWLVNPEVGLMLLFPADLRHRVEINKSDEDRVSIAFNVDLDVG